MSQTVFHYKITYEENLQIDNLESKDFVEKVSQKVTIQSQGSKRSNIVVEVSETSDFERLDNMLKERYNQVWFDF